MVLIRAFLIWLVIIAAETVHGILRGILLVPIIGDHLFPFRVLGGVDLVEMGTGISAFINCGGFQKAFATQGRELT